MSGVQWAGTGALLLGGLGANVFVLMYSLRRWRATPAGRQTMYFMALIAVLMDYFSVALLVGPYPGREWVRLGFFAVFAFLTWRFCWILWREDREGRKVLSGHGRHERHP